jgi:hypothetical protein
MQMRMAGRCGRTSRKAWTAIIILGGEKRAPRRIKSARRGFPLDRQWRQTPGKENLMTIKGAIKEAEGFVKEELNEHDKSPEGKAKAQEGRDLRNEGRVEDGKAPKTTEPGTGHPEK